MSAGKEVPFPSAALSKLPRHFRRKRGFGRVHPTACTGISVPPAAVASAACEDFFRSATCRRQATYFCRQTKVCKNCFFRLPSRGKRNCPPAISTPRLGVSQNPPAGRPRALAPDRRAIFMGHSVRILSTEDRPADAGMLSVNWQRPPKAGGRKAQDCGRERACNLAPKAQPVAPGGERVIHSSRPPDGGEKALLVPFGALAKRHCGAAPVCFVR